MNENNPETPFRIKLESCYIIRNKETQTVTIDGSVFGQINLPLSMYPQGDSIHNILKLTNTLFSQWRTNGITMKDVRTSHLRFFLDAIQELIYLQILNTQEIDFENLVKRRLASKSLGYYQEENQWFGAYIDDENLYKEDVFRPNVNLEDHIKEALVKELTKLTEDFLAKQPVLEELIFERKIKTPSAQKIPVDLAKKRAALKIALALAKMGFLTINESPNQTQPNSST